MSERTVTVDIYLHFEFLYVISRIQKKEKKYKIENFNYKKVPYYSEKLLTVPFSSQDFFRGNEQ